VKGMGPLSLLGSNIDSGVCCHNDVQERSARLREEIESVACTGCLLACLREVDSRYGV